MEVVQPWARTFKCRGKTSTPAMADMVHFNAQIPLDVLPQVLRQAGHRGVYVTPRDEQGAPKAGWSIVWISSQKAEVARLALGTPFGIRVADADYHDVFCKLRPDDQPKARVAVSVAMGPGPFLACQNHKSTGPSAVAAWCLEAPTRGLAGLAR